MPIGARIKSARFGLHPDVIDLNNRVIAAGGSMTSAVLQAYDNFVQWNYTNGLRDASGTNHTTRWLWAPLTQAYAGCFEKLWYPPGTPSAIGTSGFTSAAYAVTTGITGNTSRYITTDFIPSSHLNADQSAHFALYCRTSSNQVDSQGSLLSLNRMALNPRWTDSNTYVDYLNKRVQFSGFNGGLLLMNSLSATDMKAWSRGVQRGVNTNSTSTTNAGSTANLFLLAGNTGSAANDRSSRSISGASMGLGIPEYLMADYNTQWQTLLAAVSASRPV